MGARDRHASVAATGYSSPESRAAARIQARVRGKAQRVETAAEDADTALEWARFCEQKTPKSPEAAEAAERLNKAAALLATSKPVALELERRHQRRSRPSSRAYFRSSLKWLPLSLGVAATAFAAARLARELGGIESTGLARTVEEAIRGADQQLRRLGFTLVYQPQQADSGSWFNWWK